MTNQSWKITKGLIALLVTLLSSHAFAKAQINSEFELVLPKQFQQNLLNQKWQDFVNKEFSKNWQFPDQEILAQQDIPVKIKDIFLGIRTRLQKPSLPEAQAALELSSLNLEAQLNIGEVSVDHVIEKEVGGIVGRFRLQAVCKNVSLKMKAGAGDFAVIVKPHLGSSTAGVEVQSVRLGWLPDAWAVTSLQCSGAQGFDEILKGEIQKIAQDSQAFLAPHQEYLRRTVQDQLDNVEFDFSGARQLVVSRPDLKVTMTVDQFKDLGSAGVQVRGHFLVEFLRVPEDTTLNLSLSEGASASGTMASLRLPKDFLKEVMSRTYAANTWMHKITSDKVPGFASLMRSRFIQFFVWPELMKYPKSSQFRFDVYSNKNFVLQGQGLSYQVQGQIYSVMQSPQKQGLAPFMNFSMPLKTALQLQVQNGVLITTFGTPSMSLQAQWDSQYLGSNRVSKGFSSSTILRRIVDSIAGQTVTAELPKIPVAEGLSLTVKKARVGVGQDLILDLNP